MHKHLMAAAVCLGGISIAAPAEAGNCAKRERVVERLKTHYSESFAGGGLQSSRETQALVEVWASNETGTFTVILTTPEGVSCIVATGTDWQNAYLTTEPVGTKS